MAGKDAAVSRTIKRYRNRRLYDSTAQRYITLSDIRDLVCSRLEFSVIDHSTQHDITERILLLVLATLDTTRTAVIERDTLEHAIRRHAGRPEPL